MTDIQELFQHATDDLGVRPDLLDRVRSGGRRRVVRRRAVLAGGLAVAAAGAAAPLALGRTPGGATPAGLDRPTRGDLAGDQGFLRRVRTAWRQAVDGMAGYGEVHIWWAVSTRVSSVALVAQRTTAGAPAGSAPLLLTGFVEEIDGGPPAVTTAVTSSGDAGRALLAGADRSVLLVLDGDGPVDFSPDYRIDDRGRIVREFRRLGFDRHGVALVEVPSQRSRLEIALRAAATERKVDVANAGEVIQAGTTPVPGGLGNQIPELAERRLPGFDMVWPSRGALRPDDLDQWNVAGMTGYDDPYGTHEFAGPTDWFILGASPDRRRLVVQTRSLDRRTRIFYFLGRPGEPHYAGRSTGGPGALLHVRLPGRQGVVVASLNAALRFRTGGGGWLPVTGDAALLPAAATAVEIRPRQGEPVIVALPGR